MLFHVAEVFNGNNDLSFDEKAFASFLEEKGRLDLANNVRHGRAHHRFAFGCGCDLRDWKGFLGLFRCLRSVLNVDEDLEWTVKQSSLEAIPGRRGSSQVLKMAEGL